MSDAACACVRRGAKVMCERRRWRRRDGARPAGSLKRAAWRAGWALVVLLMLGTACLHGQQQAVTMRTVTGVVTDDHHEPLRGAVVELENPSSHEIVSYITAADGRYIFKRVDSHTDFNLWATFRGNRSSVHAISMFDSHLNKTIDIVCKTF